MKKILVLILIVANLGVFAQTYVETNQQQRAQTGPAPQKVVYVQQRPAFTPQLRLNGFAMYAFDDRVDSYYSSTDYYNGKIKGGFQWGGGLEYLFIPSQSIELSYLRLDSEAPMEYYDNRIKNTVFDIATNYILIGSNRYFPVSEKIEPFAGLQLGMAIFNVDDQNSDLTNSATKFAWGAKVGLNIWASDKIGLKIQTGLNSAVQSAGGGLYFGTGGAGAGVSTYSTFYQFYVGGGLTVKMGN